MRRKIILYTGDTTAVPVLFIPIEPASEIISGYIQISQLRSSTNSSMASNTR